VTAAVNGLEERFTTYQGKRLRYLTGGTGPPLVLCHGFIGSAENFNDWFDVLLPRRTIVAPDLPGFGHSEPLNGGHTASAMARAVLAAVEDAGVDRFDVALVRRQPSGSSCIRRWFHRGSCDAHSTCRLG
jgi:pimeloyl-ACP methyl ester carboxylesterase